MGTVWKQGRDVMEWFFVPWAMCVLFCAGATLAGLNVNDGNMAKTVLAATVAVFCGTILGAVLGCIPASLIYGVVSLSKAVGA